MKFGMVIDRVSFTRPLIFPFENTLFHSNSIGKKIHGFWAHLKSGKTLWVTNHCSKEKSEKLFAFCKMLLNNL